MGDANGFKAEKKDVASMPPLFPDNPARRVSVSGTRSNMLGENKVKTANESDVGIFLL